MRRASKALYVNDSGLVRLRWMYWLGAKPVKHTRPGQMTSFFTDVTSYPEDVLVQSDAFNVLADCSCTKKDTKRR